MKNKGLIAGFAASALTMSTHAAVFNVASGDWNVGANWDTLSVPGNTEVGQVGFGREADITGAVPDVGRLDVNGGGSGHVLDMDGGSLTATGGAPGFGQFFGGTVDLNGGSSLTIDHGIQNFGSTTFLLDGASSFTHNNLIANYGSFSGIVDGGSSVTMNSQNVEGGVINWDIVGPGNTVSFGFGSLTADDVINLTFRMDGTVADLSTVNMAALDMSVGTWNLIIDGTTYGGVTHDFTLIDAGTLTDQFDSVQFINVAGQISYDTLNGDVNVEIFGAIPEPSTFGLLAVGATLLRSRFRRRRG